MNGMKWISIIFAASLGGCLFMPVETEANIQEAFGLSPKSISMANAVSAIADDFSAAYFNPAGLGQLDHHELYFGYMYAQPELNYYSAIDPGTVQFKEDISFSSPLIGMVLDLSRAINTRGHNLVFAMILAFGNNFKTAYRIHDVSPQVPRFMRYGEYLNRQHSFLSLGLEILKEKVYIGTGVNVWTELGAKATFTVDLTAVDPLTKEADINGDTHISPIAGILVKPVSWLSLAYTYRDGWVWAAPVEFNIDLALQGNSLVPPLSPLSLSFIVNEYYLPWNMTGGLAFSLFDADLILSVDVTFYRWSNFTLPMWQNHPAWGPSRMKNWNDTILPRFGMEYKVRDNFLVRCGYYYEQSPIPDQADVRSNHLDSDKHVICAGLGYTIVKLPFLPKLPPAYPIAFDLGFQYHLMNERTQRKNILTEQSSWKIDGTQLAVGLGLTVGF